ncbi:MAG: maleylpyruvate isomerase family mycothiol-dependent enzyme [Glycomyces artemisiae]|uniref:Maleylpyruvate isomerase family mycothiol-dependent enzyme n=1 Tax=Glycomyces artemisiae TaxID=1076443 RepID=A0A850CFD1_9ACTN|nr:maleylpyruvate isomerase family mycothiol-dependent enzyme [Glycomyces artemisiae]
MSTEHEPPLDERERLDLCDLLDELGPDAPTLCEGWTTLDLAAHLVLREHFSKWTDEKRAVEKAKGLPALTARLRAGAPALPWRIPGVRNLLNGTEYLIHHEDVRRANGLAPRTGRPDLDKIAWATVRLTARGTARRIRPHGLEISTRAGESRHYGPPGGAVLTGHPVELLLYLSGRRDASETDLTGDPEAVAALRR